MRNMAQWTFSASSDPYLERFIEAASQVKTENKWSKKFGVQDSSLREKTDIIIDKTDKSCTLKDSFVHDEEPHASFSYEDFFETLENEQINVSTFITECTKNSDLIFKLTQKLSQKAVERLFDTIFNEKNIDSAFLSSFIIKFLPNYLTKHYSLSAIEILVKINEKYPDIFIKTLELLINDTDIDNNVLSSFISTQNENQLTYFIQNLTKITIGHGGFILNLHTIYTAYKNCSKNYKTQECIKKLLVNHNKACETDKNYGRLFLLYLQTEINMVRTLDANLKEYLTNHKSPFQKPCLKLFQDI